MGNSFDKKCASLSFKFEVLFVNEIEEQFFCGGIFLLGKKNIPTQAKMDFQFGFARFVNAAICTFQSTLS